MATSSRVLSVFPGGTYTSRRYGSVHPQSGQSTISEYLDSVTSPGPPYTQQNFFVHINYVNKPMRVSGAGLRYDWKNVSVPSSYGFSPAYPTLDEVGLVNAAIAQCNPEKPIMDLPLFLFELRELPRLIKDTGDALLSRGTRVLRDPGGTYLSYKFGWAPLFSDLRNLLNLSNSIEQRIKSLNEGAGERNYKAKLPGRNLSLGASSGYHVYSNSRIYYRKKTTYHETNWMTCKYSVNPEDLPSLDDGMKDRFQWALGLKGNSLVTTWNAIPWTWLIDYFSSIGSYLEATRGVIPFRAYDMCIMTRREFRETIDLDYATGWISSPSVSPGLGHRIHERRQIYPFPTAKISFTPFLTEGQFGILAALAASAVSGSSRNRNFIRGG